MCVVLKVSRCPGRVQLRDSWEGCDFYIVGDLYPLSSFTVLFTSLSILVSVTLLCKEVGGFDYKLYEEPCPLWYGADSQYLLLLSSGCCIKKKGAESLMVLCLFQTASHCKHFCQSLTCLLLVAEKSYMTLLSLSKIQTSLLENSYRPWSHTSPFFPHHIWLSIHLPATSDS